MHFDDTHIFRTESEQYLVHRTREPDVRLAEIEKQEAAETAAVTTGGMTSEKRALIDEIRESRLADLELEDPDQADTLLRKAAADRHDSETNRSKTD